MYGDYKEPICPPGRRAAGLGLVAQWITRLTTDQKIPGSNPGKIVAFAWHGTAGDQSMGSLAEAATPAPTASQSQLLSSLLAESMEAVKEHRPPETDIEDRSAT